MKAAFREYHVFNEDDMKAIWAEALVVIDTNVILDFYCFRDKTLEDYYSVLEAIKAKGNLWMPHQVGVEFHENRVGIISKQLKQYENVISYIDTAKDKIASLEGTSTGHAHLDFGDIAKQYEDRVKLIKTRIQRLRNKHPDHIERDAIIGRLEEIYTDDIVGAEFTDEQIEELTKEGEERYSKNIPPGYKDHKKEDESYRPVQRKYGDLAVWKQIIKKAEESKKPVIFVTNDAKDDWVSYAQEKRKLGAKPALRKELLKKAGVDFVLFSSDEFLDRAHTQFNITVEKESLNEVKKYREIENARERNRLKAHALSGHYSNGPAHKYLHEAMRTADKCLSRFKEAELPMRAVMSIQEVIDLYRGSHDRIERGHGLYSVVADLHRVNMLLRRCVNIVRDNDNEAIPMIDELMYLNDRLLHAMQIEDRDVDTRFMY